MKLAGSGRDRLSHLSEKYGGWQGGEMCWICHCHINTGEAYFCLSLVPKKYNCIVFYTSISIIFPQLSPPPNCKCFSRTSCSVEFFLMSPGFTHELGRSRRGGSWLPHRTERQTLWRRRLHCGRGVCAGRPGTGAQGVYFQWCQMTWKYTIKEAIKQACASTTRCISNNSNHDPPTWLVWCRVFRSGSRGRPFRQTCTWHCSTAKCSDGILAVFPLFFSKPWVKYISLWFWHHWATN